MQDYLLDIGGASDAAQVELCWRSFLGIVLCGLVRCDKVSLLLDGIDVTTVGPSTSRLKA